MAESKEKDLQGASEPEVFVHPSSYVDSDVRIGAGTKIWHFCHIQEGARIGKHCSLGQNVNVSKKVVLGDGCKVQNNVSLYEGVELEDQVFCGPSCVFTNDLNPRAAYPKGSAGYLKTLVERGATIGANATIVCGHTLHSQAMVAAGAVVTEDVPAHALVAGVPARRIGWACTCGHLFHDGDFQEESYTCPVCGRTYQKAGAGLKEVGEEN